MRSFYAPTCKTDCLQILYKFCKNWISVPNIVHQLKLSLRCKYCKIHSCSIFPDAINSIGPTLLVRDRAISASEMTYIVSSGALNSTHSLTGIERLQANDVSLLWRHTSWVRSQTLERAYRRPFLTVFGEFEPQNVVGHRVDPKKALPYVTMRVLRHLA